MNEILFKYGETSYKLITLKTLNKLLNPKDKLSFDQNLEGFRDLTE